jgi:general L-amino acid transport system substrate-binding protein
MQTMLRSARIFVLGIAALTAMSFPALAQKTLQAAKDRGHLLCGVSQGLPGFSNPDGQGNWSGLDVDFCKAVAAAALGAADKVKFLPLSGKERFTALQSGEVDILSRNTTWTLSRDTALGLNFAGVIYYDGQGFMVRRKLNVKSAKELDGATACANAGTTTELNVADFFRSHGMKYKLVTFEKSDDAFAAYVKGRCDVYTTDQSGLYAQRVRLDDPEEHVILPEIISKEPLGPAVRHGDDGWFEIVKWTLFALINAEELGVTAANAAQQRTESQNPEVRRLLGSEGDAGKSLGLDADWALRAIQASGNYGEMFERNLGSGSPLKIARNVNALWSKGGILYAPPVR